MQAPHSVHDAPTGLLEALYHPHGFCYLWQPKLLWLHAVSDTLIALAYYSIPVMLVWFVRKRKDVPFNWMFVSFAIFILACGTTHVMEIWNLWNTDYWVAGYVKAATAVASVWTAVMLVPLIPRAIDLPSPQALQRANAAMERAEGLAHLGSWQWDLRADRVEWSRELHRIYGLAPGTFEGTFEGYLSRVHPEDRDAVAATVQQARQDKLSFVLRERIVRPDGSIRVLESAGDVLLDERGEVTGMFGACHDVTDAEEAEARRRRAEEERVALEHQFFQAQKLEAVGRLAGGIAHDFNNMLLVISGSASLQLAGRDENDPAWNDLKAIEDAADRAGGLTRQLLAVARRQVFTVSDVDLNLVVREMEDMLRRSLNDDVRFGLELAPDSLVVQADAGQLNQVLLNLVVNARDAMPEGGLLTVKTSAESGTDGREIACVSVTDTGVGMDGETLKHTFEPFFTTKGSKGTGLGLATVYGIVTQSGGWIDVQSEPGKGSTFKVCLPRTNRRVETVKTGAPAAVGGSEVVLVVDDSEPVLALTSRILDRAGYRVLTAPSGEWALSVAARHDARIDLLLTDVMMPGMSGPQLAERLGAQRPDMRVLFMSGYQRTSDSGESVLPAGARLVEKPFKPDALLAHVRELLDQ